MQKHGYLFFSTVLPEFDNHLFLIIPFTFRFKTKNPARSGIFKLSDQGSNLDSSDPESDVLPVTPSDNLVFGSAKLYKFLNVAYLK